MCRSKHLPAEAAEALLWLAEGMPPEEVRAAIATAPGEEPVDTTDLAAALEHPDSRRRFVTVQSPSPSPPAGFATLGHGNLGA
jgi:hypothetical protein